MLGKYHIYHGIHLRKGAWHRFWTTKYLSVITQTNLPKVASPYYNKIIRFKTCLTEI
jgi:hypothetical protein